MGDATTMGMSYALCDGDRGPEHLLDVHLGALLSKMPSIHILHRDPRKWVAAVINKPDDMIVAV